MSRVAVTGVGVICAAGTTTTDFWTTLAAGKSCIHRLTQIPTDGVRSPYGAEVVGFDPTAHFDRTGLTRLDRFSQFALVAARQAVARAGMEWDDERADRTATIMGSGIGGMRTLEDNMQKLYGDGKTRFPPMTVPRLMINAAASAISMEFGTMGPTFCVASACASASHAIGLGFHMVRSGMADAAITGGSEAPFTYSTMKAWDALRVMASDTCRPFSLKRTGMLLGEGAAVVILENLHHARKRGADILAEVVGFGMSADARDMTAPDLQGTTKAMTKALADAKLNPDQVDYVNAHGSGTQINDKIETAALKAAFGDHAYRVPVSSSKSIFGHVLGGAGALELVATILAIQKALLPPTANYLEADPECDLDYVPNQAREQNINVALSNSFAFGGLNATLAVRRFTS